MEGDGGEDEDGEGGHQGRGAVPWVPRVTVAGVAPGGQVRCREVRIVTRSGPCVQ